MSGSLNECESRRDFLRGGACLAAGVLLGPPTSAEAAAGGNASKGSVHEALWYEKLGKNVIRCGLCPRSCTVPPDSRGACGVRENRAGTYYTLVYGRVCAIHVDPIEKKPLFHYLPGSNTLSIATGGCNIECKFCQNWDIAQARPEDLDYQALSPADVVNVCRKQNVSTVAYTYSEPTVFSEYVLETSKLARANDLGSVTISNGFISRPALVELCQHFTAVKIDLKGFTESFYHDVCSGRLRPVLNTLTTLRDLKMHYEIVALLIPTLNDGIKDLERMCAWIVKELGPDVPLHFSRFHPDYKLKNLPPTPLTTMEAAHEIAKFAGVNYCYIGNVGAHKWTNTWCAKCDALLIDRYNLLIRRNNVVEGKCPKCGQVIPGVWSQKQALAFKPEVVMS